MNKSLILIIILFFISCSNIIDQEEILLPVTLSIKFESLKDENLIHIFFQNLNKKKLSFGINHSILTENLSIVLTQGNYSIYFYGINDKTTTTKKIYSYKLIKNIEMFSSYELKISPEILTPNIIVENSDSNYNIKIMMNDLYDFLSLSSISIKQGNDKFKSIDYEYEADQKFYSSKILFKNGKWYANISYNIKSMIDEDVLKKDNIALSTSYFSNIFIGEF